MAKIHFGRPGTRLDPTDLKGEKEISWCQSNIGPLAFHSEPAITLKMLDEESSVPPDLRGYKFVVVQTEEENSELKPGFYLSPLTPKEVWEKFIRSRNPLTAVRTKRKIRSDLPVALRAMLRYPAPESGRLRPTRFVKNSTTLAAFQETFSPLNRYERNKEQTYVVVQAFESG